MIVELAGLGLRPRSLRMDLVSKSSMLGLSSELLAAGKESFLRFFSVFILPKVFSMFVLGKNLIHIQVSGSYYFFITFGRRDIDLQ